MSDDEQHPMTQQDEVKPEDQNNATINIKVCG